MVQFQIYLKGDSKRTLWNIVTSTTHEYVLYTVIFPWVLGIARFYFKWFNFFSNSNINPCYNRQQSIGVRFILQSAIIIIIIVRENGWEVLSSNCSNVRRICYECYTIPFLSRSFMHLLFVRTSGLRDCSFPPIGRKSPRFPEVWWLL